jgi:hypothetical protein
LPKNVKTRINANSWRNTLTRVIQNLEKQGLLMSIAQNHVNHGGDPAPSNGVTTHPHLTSTAPSNKKPTQLEVGK